MRTVLDTNTSQIFSFKFFQENIIKINTIYKKFISNYIFLIYYTDRCPKYILKYIDTEKKRVVLIYLFIIMVSIFELLMEIFNTYRCNRTQS